MTPRFRTESDGRLSDDSPTISGKEQQVYTDWTLKYILTTPFFTAPSFVPDNARKNECCTTPAGLGIREP